MGREAPGSHLHRTRTLEPSCRRRSSGRNDATGKRSSIPTVPPTLGVTPGHGEVTAKKDARVVRASLGFEFRNRPCYRRFFTFVPRSFVLEVATRAAGRGVVSPSFTLVVVSP